MSEGFELLVDRQALRGQGPLWMPALNCLHWLDPLRRELHTYHRETGADEVRVLPGSITALAATRGGHFVGACDRGFAQVHPGRGAVAQVAAVPSGDRTSEGACDPAGRFVAGTLTLDRSPESSGTVWECSS